MKNVTLALDDLVVREARKIASQRSTSLNAMIREFLEELVEQESQARTARARILEPCRAPRAEVGERTWTRDELHDR
jgi:predicted transcriptional regulator